MIVKSGSARRAFCDNCGTEILNIFEIGDKIYGSECIKKMTGVKPDKNRMIMIENWKAHEAEKARSQKLNAEDPLQY